MIDSEFSQLQDGHKELNNKYDQLSVKVGALEEGLRTAAEHLAKNTELTEEIRNDTKDIVEAVKIGVKVYKTADWLRLFLKNWAWVPAGLMWGIGYAKGWWKEIPWFWK